MSYIPLMGDYVEGGLKHIDIESKLMSTKFSWVQRLKDSDVHPWKELAPHFLWPLGGGLCFSFKFKFFAKSQNAV